jgi:hypothetical protein
VKPPVLGKFSKVDFELARFSTNLVGSRFGNMDPSPIFCSLEDISKEVATLNLKVSQQGTAGLPTGLATELTKVKIAGQDLVVVTHFTKGFHNPTGTRPALRLLAMGKEVLVSSFQLIVDFSQTG